MTTFTATSIEAEPLELAHHRLLDLLDRVQPETDLDESTQELGGALEKIYRVAYGKEDPLPLLSACVEQVSATAERLEEVLPEVQAIVSEIVSQLRRAQQDFSLQQFRPVPDAPVVRASQGVPTLLPVARSPRGPVPAEPPPSPFQDIEPPSAPMEGLLADPLPPFTSVGWCRQRAEELFADICACGTYRIPQLGDPWRGAAAMEERLLRSLDALVALSGFNVDLLERIAVASPAPDPALLFGLTFVGGCLTGRDGLGVAERVYRKMEGEEGFFEAFSSALALVPHPSVAPMMRAWQTDGSAERRALALCVLARRGGASEIDLQRGLEDEPPVQQQALLPLAFSGSAHLREALDRLALDPRVSQHPRLLRSTRIAAMISGHPQGYSEVFKGLREGDLTCGRLCGIAAERKDAERLLEWCTSEPTPALVEALGYAGDPACLPLLVGLLGTDDEELINTSASALERITGAGLIESVELPPEASVDNDPLAEEQPSSLEKEAQEPVPEGSPDTIELPSRDQEQWRAYLEAHQEQLVPGTCTRRGVPHSPLVTVNELDRGPCTPVERQVLCWELATRGGLLASLHVDDFVTTQELWLERVEKAVQARGVSPGSWALPLDRRVIPPLPR